MHQIINQHRTSLSEEDVGDHRETKLYRRSTVGEFEENKVAELYRAVSL